MKLKKFDEIDYQNYPFVEDFGGELVPLIAKVKMKMGPPKYEGLLATAVVDGNGILIMVYDENGKEKMVFYRELHPFPFAVFVAEYLKKPLDPNVLIRFGFERLK